MGLSNAQYDRIMKIYDQRRSEHSLEQQRRKEECYQKIPALRALQQEVVQSALSRVRASLRKAEEAPVPAPHRSPAQAEKLRRRLLLENGYPADYLDPIYSCQKCKDTGYIGELGKKRCSCFQEAVIRLFYQQSGLSEVLQLENFDSFDLSWYREDLIDPRTGRSSRDLCEDVLNSARQYCRLFDQGGNRNMLLFGPTGVGKTFLTHCIAKELMDTRHSVIYTSSQDLFDQLAREQFRYDPDEDLSFSREFLPESDLLIIDDLGTELTNAFTSTSLFTLLNSRIQAGKGTLISTNLRIMELRDAYTDRIASRFIGSFTLVRLFGEDIRCQKSTRFARQG